MAAFSDTITIHKPIDEVFSFSTNMENSNKIMPNVKQTVKITDGPITVGTQFKETRVIRGRDAEAVIEIIKYIPNQAYSVKNVTQGMEVIYHYQFNKVVEGTKIDFQCEVNASGIMMKLIKPLFIKILKKEDGDHLHHLKKAVESVKDQ
ncbi:SRPBCC family protein [Peribacillus alkalitolerans]|uniref:SRPBCC family protein n=1 Tax=Peribacillus alkalitolerans TaxID=1550385 RepID=UPI0013CFB65B|nr:SRPBCC family protein [Peribacillus alkalitolerans]